MKARLQMPSMLVAVVTAALPAVVAAQSASTEPPPVTVRNSRQYDITSKITGEQYRLMVAMPPGSTGPLPVMYVLDGNETFVTAANTALTQALRGGGIRPGIIVGVGYGTDDFQEIDRRRTFDLSPSVSQNPQATRKSGGGEAFLRVIEEEIKPFIGARYSIDPGRQAIFGHSLGALLVLHSLLRAPGHYAAYVMSSPSIWWNGREVIKREEGLAARLQSTAARARVLVTSASDEQYRGDDPARRAADNRMVDNASELAERLRRVDSSLVVERVVFEGEGHVSVVPAALSRAVRFAFAR